jgi:hypothetical protein
LVSGLLISPRFLLLGIHRVCIKSNRISTALFDVAIECVVADVGLAIGEPTVQILVTCVKNCFVGFEPVESLGFSVEKRLLIFNRVPVCVGVSTVDKVISAKFAVSDILRKVYITVFLLDLWLHF